MPRRDVAVLYSKMLVDHFFDFDKAGASEESFNPFGFHVQKVNVRLESLPQDAQTTAPLRWWSICRLCRYGRICMWETLVDVQAFTPVRTAHCPLSRENTRTRTQCLLRVFAGCILPKHQQDDEKDHGPGDRMDSTVLRCLVFLSTLTWRRRVEFRVAEG